MAKLWAWAGLIESATFPTAREPRGVCISPLEPEGRGERGVEGEAGAGASGPLGDQGNEGVGGALGGGPDEEPGVSVEGAGPPDEGAPPPPPFCRKRLTPAKPSPIWMACPMADDIGVPEQNNICMTTGVTKLPRMSQTATMPPMTIVAGVNLVATPTAIAPALTAEVTLVNSA